MKGDAPTATPVSEAEPYGAEDWGAEDDPVHIPEPMVFDLVRGLGAQRGELEVNVLSLAPLEASDPRPVEWAPEIEAAVLDGLALEFELPFEGSELEALKVAAQGTFGVGWNNRFIHGAQVIAERFREEGDWELTLLWVPGFRFSRVWSLLAMLGARATIGGEHDGDIEAIVNLSLFADVSRRASVGLELNFAGGPGADSDEPGFVGGGHDLLVMPQLHVEITDPLMIQAGVGARFVAGSSLTEAGARLIYNF